MAVRWPNESDDEFHTRLAKQGRREFRDQCGGIARFMKTRDDRKEDKRDRSKKRDKSKKRTISKMRAESRIREESRRRNDSGKRDISTKSRIIEKRDLAGKLSRPVTPRKKVLEPEHIAAYVRKEENGTDYVEPSSTRKSRRAKQRKDRLRKHYTEDYNKDIPIDLPLNKPIPRFRKKIEEKLVATNVFDTSLFALDLGKMMPYVVLRDGNLYYRNVVPEPTLENYSLI